MSLPEPTSAVAAKGSTASTGYEPKTGFGQVALSRARHCRSFHGRSYLPKTSAKRCHRSATQLGSGGSFIRPSSPTSGASTLLGLSPTCGGRPARPSDCKSAGRCRVTPSPRRGTYVREEQRSSAEANPRPQDPQLAVPSTGPGMV